MMLIADNYIRFIELPEHINGVTLPNEDGSFDIYINSRLCFERQQEAIKHELEHIKKDHFYDDIKSIEMIEDEIV